MSPSILITGGAGYIGGSVLADLISRKSGPISESRIYAIVRSDEQVQSLSKLDRVNPIQLDLNNEVAVTEAVLDSKIDIVLHLASSLEQKFVTNLINALGERRKSSGEDVFFVHASVTAMYSAEGGWTHGEIKDSGNVLEGEKQIGGPNPVRLTSIHVAELAKELGVTSFNVALPHVYGTGSGEWKKVSAQIPMYVRNGIAEKQIHRFDVEGRPPAVHIADLVELYALLTTKILQKESIPSSEHGYYFAFSHRSPWWAVTERIAAALHARGLIADASVKVWPDYDVAAKSLKLPRQYIVPMTMSTGEMVAVNPYKIGWRPEWNEERYLASIDDEVQAALDFDTITASRYDSL